MKKNEWIMLGLTFLITWATFFGISFSVGTTVPLSFENNLISSISIATLVVSVVLLLILIILALGTILKLIAKLLTKFKQLISVFVIFQFKLDQEKINRIKKYFKKLDYNDRITELEKENKVLRKHLGISEKANNIHYWKDKKGDQKGIIFDEMD